MYDPFAANGGLIPRNLRMRLGAAERAQYQAPALVLDGLRSVDAATPDLRRRVAAATLTGSMRVGLSFLLSKVAGGRGGTPAAGTSTAEALAAGGVSTSEAHLAQASGSSPTPAVHARRRHEM